MVKYKYLDVEDFILKGDEFLAAKGSPWAKISNSYLFGKKIASLAYIKLNFFYGKYRRPIIKKNIG